MCVPQFGFLADVDSSPPADAETETGCRPRTGIGREDIALCECFLDAPLESATNDEGADDDCT